MDIIPSQGNKTGLSGPTAVRLAGALLVPVLALAAASLHVPYDADPYDEGLVANGGALAISGRLPAIDYYAPYPPGAFVALGLAFRAWGVRLIVERWLAAVLAALVAALGFWLVTGFPCDSEGIDGSGWGSAALAGGCISLLLAARWVTPVTGGALALVLASGIGLRRALPGRHPKRTFLCGLCAGAAALWRLDFGFYALAAGFGACLLDAGAAGEGQTWRRRLAGAFCIGIGSMALCGPVLAWTVARGGRRAAESLFWWPLTSTAAAHLPWSRHAIAFLVPLGGLLLLAVTYPRMRNDRERAATAHWLLIVGLGFLTYSLGRIHATHLLPLRVVSVLLAALARDCLRPERTTGARRAGPLATKAAVANRSSPRRLGWLATAAFVAILGAVVVDPIRDLLHERMQSLARRETLPGPRGVGVYPAAREVRDYDYILACLRQAPSGARLFCGAPRHDLFLKSDNLAYFLSGRRSGTYFWCLDAGVTTTRPVQAEMVRELQKTHVERLLIRRAGANHEPNAGGHSSGVHLLDDYLHHHYRPIAVWEDYELCQICASPHPC